MAYPLRLTRRARAVLTATAVSLLALASAGCATTKPALTAQLQEIQRDMNGLRADNLILKDRLEALEERADAKPRRAAPSVVVEDVAPSDRPSLAVVRLTPESPPEAPIEATATSATGTPGKAGEAGKAEARPVIVGDARGVSRQSVAAAGARPRHGAPYRRK